MYLIQLAFIIIKFFLFKLLVYRVRHFEGHWFATQWVSKYLKGTQTLSIKYSKVLDFHLTSYSNSDFYGDKDNGLTTFGYLMSLGLASITWRSEKNM